MSTDRTHSQQQDENKDPTLGAPPTDTLNKVTELKAPIGGQQRSKTIRLIVPTKKIRLGRLPKGCGRSDCPNHKGGCTIGC